MFRIGLDWWHVASHHEYFARLSAAHLALGDEVHIVSAIGKGRRGTIAAEAESAGVPSTAVHEVVFGHPRQSPALKLAKCRDLRLSVFYDDRADVCDLLAAHGILALRVPRLNAAGDIAAERDSR